MRTFIPIEGLRPSRERQRAVTAGNPTNYGLFWSSVNAKILVSGIANACELGYHSVSN